MGTLIIQARTGSTRLPEKMIRDFYSGKGILEIIMENIKKVFPNNLDNIVVATTEKHNDDKIEKVCQKCGVKCFRGDEDDVLSRFIGAAKKFGADKIIRVCADNVFLDTEELVNLYHRLENSDADYVSYKTTEGKPSILTHYGFWAEGVTLNALEKIDEATKEPLYHEHVTNYIYTHPEDFKIELKLISELNSSVESIKNLRLTIDTLSDFNICQRIYEYFVYNNLQTTLSNILKYIDSHPEILQEMELNINRNQK